MATYNPHHTIADRQIFGLHLNRIYAAFIGWNDARVTRKMLEKLSDRELDDIGLSRSDIDTIV